VRAGWLLALACGCGRISFASICVNATNHDEDGDGIDDACDGCPHIPDPEQIDSDGDGVDDVCDPHPTMPIDHIVFFDPFTHQLPVWDITLPGATYTGDAISADTRPQGGAVTKADAPATDVYTFGAVLGAASTSGFHQVRLYVGSPPDLGYYCELYEDATSGSFFGITYTHDGVIFVSLGKVAEQPLGNGPVHLELDHTPPTLSCHTDWPKATPLTANIPSGFAPDHVGFGIGGLVVEVDYFIQIHSDL
jgi:hypothetical protein